MRGVEVGAFETELATTVSGWATTDAEVQAWCSRDHAPVAPEVIIGWSEPEDVTAYAGWVEGTPVAYGELWLDDEEAEVELARLIVAPDHRRRGLGRELVVELTELARQHHETVALRVVATNSQARRCYESAGFERVSAAEEQEWNQGQPVAYVWMRAVAPVR
jgi:ribosomal protein S18 acetylase RimI-like enzyme